MNMRNANAFGRMLGRLQCGSAALLFLFSFSCCASEFEAVKLCDVVREPELFDLKSISFRGLVYKGVDIINVRDEQCPERVVVLEVGDDVYRQPDIKSFNQKISTWGMHGYATVSGVFHVARNGLIARKLNVKRIRDVTRDP